MRRVSKPWGFEEIWAETEHYVGKSLHITAGHKLSRQYHVEKVEDFLVQSGKMILEVGKDPVEEIEMYPGDTFHCPPGTIHRMCAVIDTVVTEVSTNHLDDVVRLEDEYGRSSDEEMTLGDASRLLHQTYHQENWFIAVGIRDQSGNPDIILYVNKTSKEVKALFKSGWHGFSVTIKSTGKPIPA